MIAIDDPGQHADAVGLPQVLARVTGFGERLDSENRTPALLPERLAGSGQTLADWSKTQVN